MLNTSTHTDIQFQFLFYLLYYCYFWPATFVFAGSRFVCADLWQQRWWNSPAPVTGKKPWCVSPFPPAEVEGYDIPSQARGIFLSPECKCRGSWESWASKCCCRCEWHLPCSADFWLLSLLPWSWQPHPVVPLCQEAEHCERPTCIASPWQQLFVWPSTNETRQRGVKLNVFFLFFKFQFWKAQNEIGFLTSTSDRKARRFRKDTWTGALSFSSAVSSRSFRADAAFRWSFLHLSSSLKQAYCTRGTTKCYN